MPVVEPVSSLLLYTRSAKRIGAEEVVWKEVEEGWVRFDQDSGSTHLLSPLARFVIELINGSSEQISSSAIVERVLAVEQEADPVDCLIEVDAVLKILSEAQLIELSQR